MGSKLKGCLLLLTGVGIGVGISWTYHKNKYEEIIQEEIADLRIYHVNNKKSIDVEFVANENKKRDDESKDDEEYSHNTYLKKAREIINYNNYSGGTSVDKEPFPEIEEECMTEKARRPFIITPEDFASIPGFDTDTFYYHNNDVVVNDNQEVVDVEDFFGMTIEEIKEQFGVHEDNAVYIRNHKLDCDYEILLDYSDFYAD